jgi:hypothetical protein
MSSNDYEKFQQRVFDELTELEQFERQRIIMDIVRAGKRCGIDVIAEIVDKQRPVSEVIAELKRKEQGK